MVAPSDLDLTPSRSGVATAPLNSSDNDSTIELCWTCHEPAGKGDQDRRLLLINGLGSAMVNFEDGFVAEFVDRGFAVARFDNRDAGRSGKVVEDRKAPGYRFSQPPYTLVDMARDAVAILDALGWEQAHVFGQSLGGMIAQQMAITHPDRVRSLISFMSSTGNQQFGKPTSEAYDALIRPAPRDREGWIEHTVRTGRLWATPDSWSPENAWERAARKFDYGIDVDGTGRQYRAMLASGERDDELGRLAVPTLVIHGSADTLIRPDGGRRTAEVIPGARYVELEGLGHDLPASRWPILAETVASFVDDLEQSV